MGFAPHQKESWWWNEEVQTKVKAKKECCKALYNDKTDENGERYRIAKQEAKKVMREAKLATYDDMYKLFIIFSMKDMKGSYYRERGQRQMKRLFS
ncbi:hypothetical protein ACFX16_037465 [Malus domestica]